MLVLASTSPRRRSLLREAGAKFISAEPSALEEMRGTVSETAEGNALAKARSVARGHQGDVVLGADTVVSANGVVVGKPRGERHAREMLSALSGSSHSVVTGIAVIGNGHVRVAHDSTLVRFRVLGDSDIDGYIATGEWRGKAGSYAIQEEGGGFVESIEGSFSNVVGLPLELLAKTLPEFGVPTEGWRIPAWPVKKAGPRPPDGISSPSKNVYKKERAIDRQGERDEPD